MTETEKDRVRHALRMLLDVYLKDQFRTACFHGMCAKLNEINLDNSTYYLTLQYIRDNKPNSFYYWALVKVFKCHPNGCFYFPPTKIAPRIKYLKKHIEKLSA